MTPIPVYYPHKTKTLLSYFYFIYFKELKVCETCVAGYYDGVFITQNWGYLSYPEAWQEDVKECLRKSFGAVYGTERQGWPSFDYSAF